MKSGKDFINTANLLSEDHSASARKKKIFNLMSFAVDKGREIYLTFQWDTVQVGSGENRHDISEKGHT